MNTTYEIITGRSEAFCSWCVWGSQSRSHRLTAQHPGVPATPPSPVSLSNSLRLQSVSSPGHGWKGEQDSSLETKFGLLGALEISK